MKKRVKKCINFFIFSIRSTILQLNILKINELVGDSE